jgi:hypothetical protein
MTAENGAAIHYVSSGSVGKPKDGDPRAGWVELVLGTAEEVAEADDSEAAQVGAAPVGTAAASGPSASSAAVWLATRTHRVTYDVDAVAAAVIAAGLPERLANALRTA